MKQHKKLLMDLVFAAVILAAAAVLLLVRKANQTGAPLCAELIYGDSNTKLTFPLEKDADYDVDTGYLTVHIRIQDGAARFVDSPCPDHICESFRLAQRGRPDGHLSARPGCAEHHPHHMTAYTSKGVNAYV